MIMNKKLLELRIILKQRGNVTRAQREYARAELKAMKELYHQIAPSREVRHPRCGTHNGYREDTCIMKSNFRITELNMDF